MNRLASPNGKVRLFSCRTGNGTERLGDVRRVRVRAEIPFLRRPLPSPKPVPICEELPDISEGEETNISLILYMPADMPGGALIGPKVSAVGFESGFKIPRHSFREHKG